MCRLDGGNFQKQESKRLPSRRYGIRRIKSCDKRVTSRRRSKSISLKHKESRSSRNISSNKNNIKKSDHDGFHRFNLLLASKKNFVLSRYQCSGKALELQINN